MPQSCVSTWTSPAAASNGGASITRYEVALNNGGWTTAQSMASHTFTGLTSAGTGRHTLRVRAVNSAGAGEQANVMTVQFFSVTFNPNAVAPTGVDVPGDIAGGETYDGYEARPPYDEPQNDNENLSDEYINEEYVREKQQDEEHSFFAENQYAGIAPLMAGPVTIHAPAGVAIGASNIPNPGFAFTGWFTPFNEVIDGNFVPVVSVTAFPRVATNVMVTFNPNGGRLVNEDDWSREVVAGAPILALPSLAARTDGYTFVEWNTRQDGNGERVHSGSGFRENTTVWAIWNPPPAGITVTVVSPQGLPVQGAIVQFLRRTSPALGFNRFVMTNSNGIAFFPNAPAGRYAINVTHPHFASTSLTSTPYTDATGRREPDFNRNNANENQSISFTMNELSATFRSLNWGPMLYNMGSLSDPNTRISSVYGWREWEGNPMRLHYGLDVVARVEAGRGPNLGRRLLAPFDGDVVHIYSTRTSSAGLGIVMQYRCANSRIYYYVSYMHMQFLPARENDSEAQRVATQIRAGDAVRRVRPGEPLEPVNIVGLLGDTPPGTPAHLHVEVHRNRNPAGRYGRSWAHTVDPRAFYAPGTFMPFHERRVEHYREIGSIRYREYVVHQQGTSTSCTMTCVCRGW